MIVVGEWLERQPAVVINAFEIGDDEALAEMFDSVVELSEKVETTE